MDRRHLHETLEGIAKQLVAPGKGILAADESNATIAKRFKDIGVENTEANRRDYRHLLFTSPEVAKSISGVILYDETIRQKAADGTPLAQILLQQGIVPGIKVDTGAKDLAGFPGEKVTEGLDGLRERLAEYHKLGARFAKWRAVITIGKGPQGPMPSYACLAVNASALARYAALCQEAGIVPIVEPEVLMDGGHDVQACDRVTRWAWGTLFEQLMVQGVHLPGILLKPSMIVSGKEATGRAGPEEVARRTVAGLRDCIPPAVPGIVFLSGGQGPQEATEHLRLMNTLGPHPWRLSFSYGRALQEPAMKAWSGKAGNVPAAQKAFQQVARANAAAALGKQVHEVKA
ncbi:MAG: fructose-bisphosphate aldolase, class [Thermoplasmata archaeon]|jgi:fructose-bisphosphate aldolase class I|nr:fructose-bisphosphate aldolase, class [Thermoplasmata archaeon]